VSRWAVVMLIIVSLSGSSAMFGCPAVKVNLSTFGMFPVAVGCSALGSALLGVCWGFSA